MRKKLIDDQVIEPRQRSQDWLDLSELAAVEVSSEDPNFPIDSALAASEGLGWRAAKPGTQIIRVLLDKPRPLHRIRLVFSETEVERTQEFTLRWSQSGGSFKEIVRQQWNFSPHGSTREVEEYEVYLDDASVLELTLKPDLTRTDMYATLAAWRVA
jgi:hypothetical protein